MVFKKILYFFLWRSIFVLANRLSADSDVMTHNAAYHLGIYYLTKH